LRSRSSCGIIAGIVGTLALAGCGAGARQDVNEPSAKFPVAIPSATFPASQRLAQRTHLLIAIRNAGVKAIPDVAVTICNLSCAYPAPRGAGTSVQAFAEDLAMPYVANPSRPVWIVDRAPGSCRSSCHAGGAGGAVTAYANTWALGTLRPGAIATFDWVLTAVEAGRHVVAWQVAAGLNGKAKAVLANGSKPQGAFIVTIHSAPAKSYVTASGRVVVVNP
jgi:hypothetical protein